MVILQFNKLIRNKWVWGVFAVGISAAFCFDDLFTSRNNDVREDSAGTLGGETISWAKFRNAAADVRGIGINADNSMPAWEANRRAWEQLASTMVSERNGIAADDAEMMEVIRSNYSFWKNGVFDFEQYRSLLAQYRIYPEQYEELVKRGITASRPSFMIAEAATWAAPAEIDRAISDMTDIFTVKVASFKQTKAEAEAIKLDEAALRKWYDENTNSIALPERIRLRYVRFDAASKKYFDAAKVTLEEMQNQYDATTDRYTSKDTNGVEVVKSFDEVKGEIERELKLLAAVECLETNLNFRVYEAASTEGASRLDEIAKEEGLKVEVSDWFAVDGSDHEGFTVPVATVCAGAEGLLDTACQLDSSCESYRYGVVLAKDAAWLIERAEVSPAHVPTYDESKEIVRPRALADLRAKTFKAYVEGIAAKGAEAVLKTKEVSTNYVFSVEKISEASFPDRYQIASAAMKLMKGEVSDFVSTGDGSAVLVVMVDRKESGDFDAVSVRNAAVNSVRKAMVEQLRRDWVKWNLARLSLTTRQGASLDESDFAEEAE